MDEKQIKEIIKNYIKENLVFNFDGGVERGFYGESDTHYVTLKVSLDGEEIFNDTVNL